jgi:AraC family transcriptional regulator
LETSPQPDSKNLADYLFDERETELYHAPYKWEQALIGYIIEGNTAMVEHVLSLFSPSIAKPTRLAESELRQMQYHAVILVYAVSRAAIQAGMFEADALNRSDEQILKFDQQSSPQEVSVLLREVILEWTRTMRNIRSLRDVSPPIRACLEYMFEHLHSRISLKELSKVSGLSSPYVSVLFKKEVGENISAYLLRLKIKAAQEMLLNTKRSTKDIGFYLNFSSQSYFIRCFKQISGVTPREFRKKG